VERVSVGVNRQNVNALIHNRPRNELAAKFQHAVLHRDPAP